MMPTQPEESDFSSTSHELATIIVQSEQPEIMYAIQVSR